MIPLTNGCWLCTIKGKKNDICSCLTVSQSFHGPKILEFELNWVELLIDSRELDFKRFLAVNESSNWNFWNIYFDYFLWTVKDLPGYFCLSVFSIFIMYFISCQNRLASYGSSEFRRSSILEIYEIVEIICPNTFFIKRYL